MKTSMIRNRLSTGSGRFVLTRAIGEKISAVEGMELTERMAKILDRNAGRALSGDEKRALIKEQARKR